LSQLKQGRTSAAAAFAAIDVTRPLPFTALPRPALGDLAKDPLRKRDSDEWALARRDDPCSQRH
jgi:uncharacterized membrane protein YcjF (UPF0283 family)